MPVNRNLHQDIVALRYLIGFMGEAGQADWWSSRFLSTTSGTFLKPMFGKTIAAAQYHGVREAAARVHDERIGVGRVFHLFRLPEGLEQRLFAHLPRAEIPGDLGETLVSRDAAMAGLQGFLKSPVELHPGPVQVGTAEDLLEHTWLSRVAAIYHSAFQRDAQSFPYFVERL